MTTTDISTDLQTLLPALMQEIQQHYRVPIATYRLQLHAGFTFTQAQHIIPYLYALGISDGYTSPYLQARPGSPHGYDVTNPQVLNAEIGTEADYTAFTQTLQHYGMGHVLDIVPNHMGIIGGDNPWWRDVLEHGPASAYARFFDINWQPPKTTLHNKILLPILGAPYGTVLENQELRLHYTSGAFELHYYEHRLPIAPCTIPDILHACLADLQQRLGSMHPQTLELSSIMTALTHLPQRTEQAAAQIAERYRETAVAKHRLAALHDTCMELQTALTQTVHTYNGTPGQAASFDRLHALLEAQSYRLSDWHTATDELNYRRFFDIVHLAGVRVEDPVVFEAMHRLIGQLLQEGKVTGLRIDHPDGLFDPARYFRQVQHAYVLQHSRRLLAARAEMTDSSERLAADLAARFMAEYCNPSDALSRPLYLVIEKILETHEHLPEDWHVHGTTGYDFLNQLNGLFVDSRHAPAFAALYTDFVGARSTCAETLYTTKKLILHTSLASELDALGCLLERVAEADRCWRDCTRRQLVEALCEVIVCFPVYRTYISNETVHVRPADRAMIETAIAAAQQRHPGIHARVFALLHDVLTLRYPPRSDESVRHVQRLFVQRFQQLTGPAMAKGLEDTAFYRYTPLTSLNEVGGDPDQFGVSVPALHQYNVTRQQHWPGTLLATSTHDTKRSEDVRARLNVLSEIPQQWRDCLGRWQRLNQQHKTTVDGQLVPSRQDEYVLYQTLLGAWPLQPLTTAGMAHFCERIQAYMRKAIREAKVYTTWTDPHPAYEDAVQHFVQALLDTTRSSAFLEDFRVLQQRVAHYGMWNSLAQTLLKLASPGVPDCYQGCELWDFSLVDPDNRRAVDYAHRQRLLADMQQQCQQQAQQELVRELLRSCDDGRIKLYVIWQVLTFRRTQAQVFLEGEYMPLQAVGSQHEHLCAFARRRGNTAVVAIAPRLVAGLLPEAEQAPIGQAIWGDTRVVLPDAFAGSALRQLFTGAIVNVVRAAGQAVLPLATALAEFPVALLHAPVLERQAVDDHQLQ